MSEERNRLAHTSGYYLHHFEYGWKRMPVGITKIRIRFLYWNGTDTNGHTKVYPVYNHTTNQHLVFVGFRTHDVQWSWDESSKTLTLTTTADASIADVRMAMPHEIGDLSESPRHFVSLQFCSRPLIAKL